MTRPAGAGQANLLGLAVALVVLTAATGVGIAVADGAFTAADRQPADRYAAVALAERLTNPDGSLATRRNVLERSALRGLTRSKLEREYPVARGQDVRVRLDERTILSSGDPDDGVTARRIVLVSTRQTVTREPPLDRAAVTIPRRTARVRLQIDPPPRTTVRMVRANDRIVLRNVAGLAGTYSVQVSRFETVRLSFEASGDLPRGSVAITYYPERTTKGVLAVTVDA